MAKRNIDLISPKFSYLDVAGVITCGAGVTINPEDKNLDVGNQAYWYGLGLDRKSNNNFITLGGFYGVKIFDRSSCITLDPYQGIAIDGNLTVNGKLVAKGGIEEVTQSADSQQISGGGISES